MSSDNESIAYTNMSDIDVEDSINNSSGGGSDKDNDNNNDNESVGMSEKLLNSVNRALERRNFLLHNIELANHRAKTAKKEKE
ncbi:hypothetical protein AYI70_g10138 [Smittium culicis]|uniref:Uncharacterized protein n=1 Tax=Smittium culicis TaxID=133412 RepID=A0A1R1X7Z9_9FUNG|nr:hypothetical protein AYI70_g10138 [Smittium culicis]